MTDVNELNSLSCSLAGCALIEAAAGTGKTYNIQNIFARCILEKGMTVDQLVVVTFTKAATMELKMRIRKILVDIREAMENEDDLTDEQKRAQKLLDAVKEKLKEEMPAPEKEVRRRLENALLDIDQANIFTIDGFCQRILNEFAVSGGVRFAIEPIADNKKEIREFSSVFMRSTENGFSQDGEDKVIYDSLCAAVGIKVDMLEELAIVDAEKSGVKLIWPEAQNCNAENGDLLKPMKDFMQKVRDFYQNLWKRPEFSLDNREAFIKAGNSRGKSVNNAKYVRWALFGGKDPGADEGLREFREWISGTGTKMPNIFAAVIQAAPEQLSKAKTNKSAKNSEEKFENFYALGREIQSHAEDLEKLLEGFRHALLWSGLEFVRQELNAHQMRTGTMSYNAV
ncbi:MAG: UvrD-helicase domain-containing protein, partial [Victivallales bacterium]|nr:UvrD-helicase domain-containing protein [Victivallales bacterium]